MILLEIDVISMPFVELECDAPGAVHMNGVARRDESPQRMEVVARQLQIIERSSQIDRIEADKDTLVKPDVDLRGAPALEKFQQRLVFLKLLITMGPVNYLMTCVNRQFTGCLRPTTPRRSHNR